MWILVSFAIWNKYSKTFCLTTGDHPVRLQEREGEAMKPSELKAILEDHRLWVESGYKQGKRANLRGADLRDANLLDANLLDANLLRANLRGADLQGADLQSANLQYANLQDANLEGAYLRCADLQSADLEDANLQDANLRGANLYGANLRGADLEGATFDLNFKQVGWFFEATFSEDQIAWVALHPKFSQFADTLKWVKAEQLSA